MSDVVRAVRAVYDHAVEQSVNPETDLTYSRDELDVVRDDVIQLLMSAGYSAEDDDANGEPISDEVQSLLTAVFLRAPKLATMLGVTDFDCLT